MSVLVTGGSGFIGRAVTRRLAAAGAGVVVADLEPFPDPGVECVQGDLRDPAVVAKALERAADGIVHLAALTRVLDSLTDPEGYVSTNVGVTAALLEGARLAEVPAFVFASTNAVAGDVGRTPITESVPLHPLTPYGATKAAAEMLVAGYGAAYPIAVRTLRLTNVYGTDMATKDSFVARIMKAAAASRGVDIYGDGTQVRDYVYLDDVVDAMLWALGLSPAAPAPSAEPVTMIVGAGRSVSVLEIVELARAATGAPIPARHVPPKAGEMPAVIVDTSRARELGPVAAVPLEEGLRRTWQWWGRSR